MAACLVCSTPFIHYNYAPVNPGCECGDRICQNCSRCGDLTRCPTCRKTSPMTAVDHVLLKSTRKTTPAGECLGCSVSFPSKQLSKHERACPVFRDWFDRQLHAEVVVRSQQLDEQSESTQEMVNRLSWQEERIDDLEDLTDELTQQAAHNKRRNDELRTGLAGLLSSLKTLLKRSRAPTPPPQQHRYFEDSTDEEDDAPIQPPPPQRRRFAPLRPPAAAVAVAASGAGAVAERTAPSN